MDRAPGPVTECRNSVIVSAVWPRRSPRDHNAQRFFQNRTLSGVHTQGHTHTPMNLPRVFTSIRRRMPSIQSNVIESKDPVQ